MTPMQQRYRRFRSRMTEQQAANLNILQNFLDGPVPRGRLDMDRWQDSNFDPNTCGTRACAMGWACAIPQLRAQGLAMRRVMGRYGDYKDVPVVPSCAGVTETAAKLFGVRSEDDFDRLFGRNGYRSGRVWDDPRHAAAAIRAFMVRCGYEPTIVTEPEFQAFMAKLHAEVRTA